jgi:hypothetical protein
MEKQRMQSSWQKYTGVGSGSSTNVIEMLMASSHSKRTQRTLHESPPTVMLRASMHRTLRREDAGRGERVCVCVGG